MGRWGVQLGRAPSAPYRQITGPLVLFAGWAIHDVEEAIMFPATAKRISEVLRIPHLRMSPAQSWTAVSLMGLLVGGACMQGAISSGRSLLYRATVAGLEAHVATHILSSTLLRGYSAGVLTALPVMWPAAVYARRSVNERGVSIRRVDYVRGVALLVPAACVCHALSRKLAPGTIHKRTRAWRENLQPSFFERCRGGFAAVVSVRLRDGGAEVVAHCAGGEE